jgi:tetratricopeptide (TPR) repeat protein
MAKPKTVEIPVPDPTTVKVESNADYLERGWLYYSKKDYSLAIDDFEHVLTTEPENIDALYGLGLTQKASGANPKALDTFEQVLRLLPSLQEPQRKSVLTRLTKGHINQIKSGNWNLEKEVWKSRG